MRMNKKGKMLNMMSSDSSSPFYYRVAETLKGRILSGRYMYGSFLPSESGLESEFGVSNITIRKALSLLVQDGLIERKRATGTRIVYKEEERLIIKITGNFLDWYNSAYEKMPYEVEVVEIVITECPEKIRTILSLGKNEKIWRMTRIRKIKGEPISFYTNYAPPKLLGRLSAKDFKNTSFLKVFQNKSKMKLSHMEHNITAINADIDLCDMLQVDFGAPLLFSETIYYSDKNTPMEVTHMYYRGDRYTYRATLPLDIP